MTSILSLFFPLRARIWGILAPMRKRYWWMEEKNLHAKSQLIRNRIGQMECAPSPEFGIGVRRAEFGTIRA